MTRATRRAIERSGTGLRVQAWFRDQQNIHTQVTLAPGDAGNLYKTGNFTVVVENVNVISPEVQELLASLARETRTPMKALLCNAYCSPVGKGTRMHFDCQENFFLQIRGKKTWTIAPNEQIKDPSQNFTHGSRPHAEISALCSTFPTEMPSTSEVVTLEPGSVLYLPRGDWHEARTEEESLHLTLTLTSSSWGELLLTQLWSQLLLDEKFRAPAVATTSPAALSMQTAP